MTPKRKKYWGKFSGDVDTRWLADDPRKMLLLSNFWFFSPSGTVWKANEDSIINGASVPWFFRRLFPIFVGRYRRATVIHDVFCDNKEVDSTKVHKMFYEAMRCDNTEPFSAIILWLAVRFGGPQFKANKSNS